MKNQLSKHVTRQQDQSDCGVACLSTIIKYHQGNTSLEELRKLSGTSRQGTTLLGLMQAAQQIGFEAEGLEAEGVHNLNELTAPAILHVAIENKLQHYLVYFPQEDLTPNPSLKERGAKSLSFEEGFRVRLFDPAKGIVEMTHDELDKIWQSKTLLTLRPTDKFVRADVQRSRKKEWIMNLVKDDFPILMISLFLGILISLLGLSTAIFSQKLIDDILPKGNTEKLVIGLVLVSSLLLVRSGLNYLRGTFMLRQGMEFNNRIIQWFYEKLLHLPKPFFDTRKTGDLIARMHDTRRIQSVLSVISGSVVIDLLVILVSLVFVFVYSVPVGLVLLGCLPVYAIMHFAFHKPIVAAQKESMVGYAMAESNFVDSIQGVAEIKLLNKQTFFEQVNALVYGIFQDRLQNLGKINIRFGLMSEITGTVFIMGVFATASWLVLSKQILIGEMVALLGMTGGLLPAVNRLVVSNIHIQEALIAFDRMFEFTSVEKEKDSELSQDSKWSYNLSDIALENISFRFPGRKQILKNISFQATKGELVCLLGESGQGKSTLMQILQKFYVPESGNVLINGNDWTGLGVSEWREQVGSVPQEPKIFNGTLLYNITLSDKPEIFQQAVAFCEEAGFGKYFNELPQSYLSLVGEEGINLSGGQKQLVALARALFRKPKLILLDEPTSSMDKKMEEFVMGLLQKNKHERITILVTHRTRPARQCDKIIALQNGEIVNQGNADFVLLDD
jgi:ATP-binding cassette, subfamily C, bacteriocin exporter